MPLSMREAKRGGTVIGYAVVDDAGKVAITYAVGRMVAGRRVASLEDAREKALAYLQRVNIEVHQRKVRS